MYPLTPVVIVVRLRLNKTIETVSHLTITHHDYSYGADARWLQIGRLEVYGDEVANHLSLVNA